MKIFVFSDLHGNLLFLEKHKPQIQEADLVLACGDFIDYYANESEAKTTLNTVFNFLKNQNFYFIWGNVDKMIAKKYNLNLKQYEKSKNTNNNIMYLNNKIINFKNLKISGLDYNIKPKKYIFNTDILITHEPPFNTNIDLTFTGEHIGNKYLKKEISRNNINYWFCGHVHEAKGIISLNKTKIINVGSAMHNHYFFKEI